MLQNIKLALRYAKMYIVVYLFPYSEFQSVLLSTFYFFNIISHFCVEHIYIQKNKIIESFQKT